ncbi:MAG: outer membrane protein assembly factor BamE [Proteobacteria bacterium]|nr:outer membrane protein assembly factor BamE [Pseudomonadota bacterium]
MQKLLTTLALCATLILAGCSTASIPGQYKIDIQQGNVISQEAVAKLKPGMTKSQVRFALGTPLLVDVFHQDRWDYIYSIQRGGQERQQRHLSLFFADDKLTRIEGDVQPAAKGEPSVASPSAPSQPGTDAAVPVPLP